MLASNLQRYYGMQTNNEMYKNITEKLGFRPEDYIPAHKDYECDNINSPFESLSAEELRFLLKNNCFKEQAVN